MVLNSKFHNINQNQLHVCLGLQKWRFSFSTVTTFVVRDLEIILEFISSVDGSGELLLDSCNSTCTLTVSLSDINLIDSLQSNSN
jgi:hypothetical protein